MTQILLQSWNKDNGFKDPAIILKNYEEKKKKKRNNVFYIWVTN